jgi:hypothetical protein
MIGSALFAVSAILSGLASRRDARAGLDSDDDDDDDASTIGPEDDELAVATSKHLRIDHIGGGRVWAGAGTVGCAWRGPPGHGTRAGVRLARAPRALYAHAWRLEEPDGTALQPTSLGLSEHADAPYPPAAACAVLDPMHWPCLHPAPSRPHVRLLPGHAIGHHAALTAPALAAYLESRDDASQLNAWRGHDADVSLRDVSLPPESPLSPPKPGWLRDP